MATRLPKRIVNDGHNRTIVSYKRVDRLLTRHRRRQILEPAADYWVRIQRQQRWWPRSGITPRPQRYPVRSGRTFTARVTDQGIDMEHPYDYPLYLNRKRNYLERSYRNAVLPHIRNRLIRNMDRAVTKELKRL